MNNKNFLKWLVISLVCAIILWFSIYIKLFFTSNNDVLWALSVCGITLSFLGFIFSVIMFAISIIRTILPMETKETFADNFIHLRALYKNGLLTKEEFDKKKKELWEKEE